MNCFVSFRFTTNRSRKREKYAREFRKVTKHFYERWREKREEFFPFVSMDATLERSVSGYLRSDSMLQQSPKEVYIPVERAVTSILANRTKIFLNRFQ